MILQTIVSTEKIKSLVQIPFDCTCKIKATTVERKIKKEHRKSVNVSYMQRKGCRLRTRVHIRQSNDFKITAEQSDS